MNCSKCTGKECYFSSKDCSAIAEEVRNLYTLIDRDISRTAAGIESDGYMRLTRLEETILFARRMGWEKIGIAFCIGLSEEVRVLEEILEREFIVSSICCKSGGIPKEDMDMKKLQEDRYESMCNPILQAEVLNREGTDINIIFGLCVGHDMLFTKHSKAPVTTLIAKDRVLAHNPMGAIYSAYHRNKIIKDMGE